MKKILALLLITAALCIPATSANAKPAHAKSINFTYCNMYYVGQTCKSPWGPNYAHYIYNGGGGGTASVYCFAHHTDGSWTGGTVQVNAGETKALFPNGYNQAVCQMNDDGFGGFPISIHSYQ